MFSWVGKGWIVPVIIPNEVRTKKLACIANKITIFYKIIQVSMQLKTTKLTRKKDNRFSQNIYENKISIFQSDQYPYIPALRYLNVCKNNNNKTSFMKLKYQSLKSQTRADKKRVKCSSANGIQSSNHKAIKLIYRLIYKYASLTRYRQFRSK